MAHRKWKEAKLQPSMLPRLAAQAGREWHKGEDVEEVDVQGF